MLGKCFTLDWRWSSCKEVFNQHQVLIEAGDLWTKISAQAKKCARRNSGISLRRIFNPRTTYLQFMLARKCVELIGINKLNQNMNKIELQLSIFRFDFLFNFRYGHLFARTFWKTAFVNSLTHLSPCNLQALFSKYQPFSVTETKLGVLPFLLGVWVFWFLKG